MTSDAGDRTARNRINHQPNSVFTSLRLAPPLAPKRPGCQRHRACARVPRADVVAQRRALDVDVGDEPVEPVRQPPGPVAREMHERRDDQHPDDEGVEQDTKGEREANRPDHRGVGEHEPAEDRDHDDRGRGDDGATGADARTAAARRCHARMPRASRRPGRACSPSPGRTGCRPGSIGRKFRNGPGSWTPKIPPSQPHW